MSCPSSEVLVSFAAADLGSDERVAVRAHIDAGCQACAGELADIARLRHLASSVLEEPAPWVVERAGRIPEEKRGGVLAAIGRLADLVFDSLRDPLPAGARATAFGSRQMLFRALDYDVDVRIAKAETGAGRIWGQVTPGQDRPIDAVAGIEVALEGPGGIAKTVRASELGEFDFGPAAPGSYEIVVEVAEEPVRLGPIEIDSVAL